MKSKTLIKYLVDIGLAITFILTFLTGLFKWPGLIHWLGSWYRSLPLRTFTIIHDWAGLLMGLLVITHVILNWKWLVSVTKTLLRGSQ